MGIVMEEKSFNCSLELAYPPEADALHDRRDIITLYRLYAAKLAAFDRYLYLNIVNAEEHRVLADIYDCIAVCELKHFKMLGHILHRSGVSLDVRGAVVGAKCGASDGFSDDIAAEEASSLEFARAAAACADEKLSQLYSRLALDEEHHAEILARVKKRYKADC